MANLVFPAYSQWYLPNVVQDRGVFEPATGSSVSKAQYTGGVHLTAVVVAKTLKSCCSRKVRAPIASELGAYTQRAKCWQCAGGFARWFSGGPLPLFHYIWHFPDRKNTIYGGLPEEQTSKMPNTIVII